jgi:tellurite resistance protein
MFGIFKKKVRKAAVEVKKMENRDAVEATVWGAYAIAYADGTCDAKEIGVLEKTISALPSFSPFAGEIAQMSSNIRSRYEASRVLLTLKQCASWPKLPAQPMRSMFCAVPGYRRQRRYR